MSIGNKNAWIYVKNFNGKNEKKIYYTKNWNKKKEKRAVTA